ncbi:hypothetical protein POJ06DRAFT_253993 [Lipomyces tetrasporus]|uniref:Zn(2)-C6 fungal-type domain-containing protein n=1 Tax=Lipomyces tetrasporus TaxID=54092 RepID=A0AAD7QQF5_9ASCO|nr:uncharacterized protein POJ06DRAFT_253993 [Lipomyces tetrasporus]KAJ8099589.1 hypothetical protein POJ06DRAFT_253993 [Lipomyces tetrasporus]
MSTFPRLPAMIQPPPQMPPLPNLMDTHRMSETRSQRISALLQPTATPYSPPYSATQQSEALHPPYAAQQDQQQQQQQQQQHHHYQADLSDDLDHPREVRKRRRIPVVCAVCRQRKLKCDRNQPCSACVAHDTTSMCTYAVKPWTSGKVTDRAQKSAVPASARSVKPTPAHKRQPNGIITPKLSAGTPSQADENLRPAKKGRPRKDSLDPKSTPEYTELQMRMERMESVLQRLAQAGVSISGLDEPVAQGDKAQAPVSTPQLVSSIPTATSTTPSGTTIDTPSSVNVLPAPPVSASAMDMRVVQPEICIKNNRLTYFGPLSGVAAIREDEFIKKCLNKVEEAKKILARKAQESRAAGLPRRMTGPEKGHTSHDTAPPRKVSYIPPDMKDWVEDIFNVAADPVDLFPRLEHRPICEFLIDRFMQTINIMFPIVNPAVFRCDMRKFWQAKDLLARSREKNGTSGASDDKPFWMSTRKNDIRGAALFAVLLRLGRLSLTPDWEPAHAGFDNSLAVLFGPRLQAFAWSCLRETNYMGKANLVVAQVLLGIRVHQIIAPEDGDGSDGSDSAGFLGMMCQVAMSMGLHRDPSLINGMPPTLEDTWRILWSQLVILDTYRSLDLALPFAIPLEMCDTALDRIRRFPDNVASYEQFSQTFMHTHIKWALLARTILSRIMRPDYVLSLKEFHTLADELNQFEESHLSSFQSLISVVQVENAVSSLQDSYNLIQKFILQLLFLRLQLSLLRSYAPPDLETAESFRRARLRCALKMLDTMATCMQHRRLFDGFEWLLVPFSLRNFFYPLALVMNGLFKAYYANPNITLPPIPPGKENDCEESRDERWLTPDLSFLYDDASICNVHRLYQAFVKTHMWIKLFCETYYGAYKPNSNVRVFAEYVRHEIVGGVLRCAKLQQAKSAKGLPYLHDQFSLPSVGNTTSTFGPNSSATSSSQTFATESSSTAVTPTALLDEHIIFGGEDWAANLAVFDPHDLMGNSSWQEWSFQLQDADELMQEFTFDGFGSAHAYAS